MEKNEIVDALSEALGEVAGAIREIRADLVTPERGKQGAINELTKAIREGADQISTHLLILTATIEDASKGQGQDCKGGCNAKR